MSEPQCIVDFSDFLASAPGRYVLDWEQSLLDQAVSDIFGYHAMQLGMPQIDTLRENRMPLRCVALDRSSAIPQWTQHDLAGRREAAVVARFDELPFASQSIDLIVLPHVLEFSPDPHSVLREVDRVLMPEGHLVLTGFNPASIWGAHHWLRRIGVQPFLPRTGQLIALPRLKDWLKLLSFEVNRGRFGCYVPSVRTAQWLARWSFLEKAGDRWWPVLGSVYSITAIKRVHGMRLVGLIKARKELRAALAPAVPIAHRIGQPVIAAGDPMAARIGVSREAANEPAIDAAHG